MKLKHLIVLGMAMMVIMPMIGVGVVWYTTSRQLEEQKKQARDRQAMEAKRWEEIRAQQNAAAQERSKAEAQADDAVEFNDKLKQPE